MLTFDLCSGTPHTPHLLHHHQNNNNRQKTRKQSATTGGSDGPRKRAKPDRANGAGAECSCAFFKDFFPQASATDVLRASSKGLWPDPVPGSSPTPTPLCALSTQSFPYNLMSEEFWLWTVLDTWEQTTSGIGQRNKEKGPWSPSPHTQAELSGGSLKARGTVVRPTPNGSVRPAEI